jgi:hypothetical protein
VLLLANHTESEVEAAWDFDAARYGYRGGVMAAPLDLPGEATGELSLPARGAVRWPVGPGAVSAWELRGTF